MTVSPALQDRFLKSSWTGKKNHGMVVERHGEQIDQLCGPLECGEIFHIVAEYWRDDFHFTAGLCLDTKDNLPLSGVNCSM